MQQIELNTSGTLRNYYKDKYKTSITGKTANNENTKKVEFSVPSS